MGTGVLVVGALNVDLVVATDRLPGPGETVVGPRLDRFGGGKGANAAVAAARMDAPVRFCGAVGADDLGRAALDELRGEGIDVADVTVLDETSTGTALIVVDAVGENQIAVAAGANAGLLAERVRAAVSRSMDWAGCVLVSSEIPAAAVEAAVSSASDHGIVCVLNPAPVAAELITSAHRAGVLTPNTTELRDLCGVLNLPLGEIEDQARHVARATGTHLAVTRGADGVLVAAPDGTSETIPAHPAPVVADTTGAGDTFNGVLAATLATGAALTAAARRAALAASLSVRRVGARPGMPFAAQVTAASQGTGGVDIE